jgi:GNAT superfamily N-acetyltransferase
MTEAANLNVPLIRHVAGSDLPGWLPLWEGYNRFYGRDGATALPPLVTETTWQRLLDPSEQMFALVAEVGGQLAGLAHYLFHRSTTALPSVCYLQDLFTAEPFRGRGIAGALIERVYEGAKAAGARRVYWHTHETNFVAQRLYEKLAERSGFIVFRKSL